MKVHDLPPDPEPDDEPPEPDSGELDEPDEPDESAVTNGDDASPEIEVHPVNDGDNGGSGVGPLLLGTVVALGAMLLRSDGNADQDELDWTGY